MGGTGTSGASTAETAWRLVEAALRALHQAGDRPCLILHGPIASGKTQTAAHLARSLAEEGVSVGGILAPRIVKNGATAGYDVEDLGTGARRALASLSPPGVVAGRYFLSREGLDFARNALFRALDDTEVVFVDEVGRLELAGGGHAAAIRAALTRAILPVFVVRSSLVGETLARFEIERALALAIHSQEKSVR